MNVINRITRRFSKVQPLPAGVHQFQAAPNAERPYRLHLRLEADGSGVLVVNAATVLHLNPTAAECAFHFVQGTPPDQAAKQIASRYRVSWEAALKDYQDSAARIETLATTPDLDPVSYLDFERVSPHSADLTAPLRLDCALTYRLPEGASAEYAPTKRVDRELTTEEWQLILEKAWQAGIPHVTFTGGEATLREDLPALIAHAEKLGQVCGLLTNGLKLADPEYLGVLLGTGLDHLLFLLQPESEESWTALEVIMPEDLFVTVHVTIRTADLEPLRPTLERLARLGVTSLSIGLADPLLRGEIEPVLDQAASLGITLAFDLPVPYSAQNPVALETAENRSHVGAGKSWLYVEPDGDVLPAQGMSGQVLGNILRDEWEKIYPVL
jgi:pyruvate-formate lyase-activating enzyme